MDLDFFLQNAVADVKSTQRQKHLTTLRKCVPKEWFYECEQKLSNEMKNMSILERERTLCGLLDLWAQGAINTQKKTTTPNKHVKAALNRLRFYLNEKYLFSEE